ncbi:MAG: hypothetical protein KAS19_05825, partial [Anaerolineales bacterium]|nr:hypothetical protein [Anaerolineales bacterium]
LLSCPSFVSRYDFQLDTNQGMFKQAGSCFADGKVTPEPRGPTTIRNSPIGEHKLGIRHGYAPLSNALSIQMGYYM